MARQSSRTPGSSGTLSLLLATLMLAGALAVVWLSYDRTPTRPTAATSPTAAPSSATASPTAPAPPTPSAMPQRPAAGALTAEGLLTPEDLAAPGIVATDVVTRTEPLFPVLCGAGWTQTWGEPTRHVGQEYPAAGAAVTEHAMDHADDAAAAAVLQQVLEDATTCSSPDSGSIAVTAPDAGLGDGSAVLRFDGAGRDAAPAVTWAVVVRSADRLLLTTYTTTQSAGTGQGPVDGGDDAGGDAAQAASTARVVAAAALQRLRAAGQGGG